MSYIETLKLRVPETCVKSVFKPCEIVIDEWYFRLHYKTTTMLLVLLTALVSVDQFVGTPILCDTSDNSLLQERGNSLTFRSHFVDTFCLIQTTFSIPYYVNRTDSSGSSNIKRIGLDGLLISRQQPTDTGLPSDELHYAYYQWVPFFLFLQGISFYAPHYVWRHIGHHKIKQLLQSIHKRNLSKSQAKQAEQIDLLGKYIWACHDGRIHYRWVLNYLACEGSNLLLLLGNMYLTNVFVGNEFTSYGFHALLSLIQKDSESRTDPMSFVFPRMTKCSFMFFGPSGNIQKADTICLLTMNLVNEKVFVILWFWFLILLSLTTIGFVVRLGTIVSLRLRTFKFGRSMVMVSPASVIQVKNGSSPQAPDDQSLVDTLVHKMNILDWILVRFIQLNIDERTFQVILARVSAYRQAQIHCRSDTKLIH